MDDRALLTLARALQASGYGFVTTTPATHARVNARAGNAWATDLTGVFGWSRPFRSGVVPPDLMVLMEAAGVLTPFDDGWRSAIRVSSLGGMLFVHSSYPTDAADAVFFGPDTYRFADAITAFLQTDPHPVRRAVDIGCGAGPGALVIAAARPAAQVMAVDLNDGALQMTRVNAALAGLGGVEARFSDILSGVDGLFDLIVSNPPYLADPAKRSYRHGGGPLGADLSLAILRAGAGRLAPGGTLLLYTGAAIVAGRDPLHDAVAGQLADLSVDWVYREVDPDVFGEELDSGAYAAADRIAAVVLTVKNKD